MTDTRQAGVTLHTGSSFRTQPTEINMDSIPNGTLRWGRREEKGEYVYKSDNGRFTFRWCGRMTPSYACYQMYDAVQKKHYRGLQNLYAPMVLAEKLMADNVYKVGLVACCGEKLGEKCAAHTLYQSPLFRKASAYASKHYREWFILSAKYGLVAPEDVIEPYDMTLKNQDETHLIKWGYMVRDKLMETARKGEKRCNTGSNSLMFCGALFYMHAGADYCDPLEGKVPMEYPMRGMGIGKQLAFYTDK